MLQEAVDNYTEFRNWATRSLLTLKNQITQLPNRALHALIYFFFWFTRDYDIGYALLHSWYILMLYFIVTLISKYTNIFENIYWMMLWGIDLGTYFVATCWWFSVTFWIPLSVLMTGGLVSAHYRLKKRREQNDMMWSYVDDEDDVRVDITQVVPQPINARGWGPRDEDIELMENFVAPTKYIKISGMIGYVPGYSMTDNIVRMNMSLKQMLAPGAPNGPYPWVKVTMETQVALVYIRFKTIEDATRCFKTLDGLTFDGQFLLLQ